MASANSSTLATGTTGTARAAPKFTPEDKQKFVAALTQYAGRQNSTDILLNCLGSNRQGEVAALAREELKKIIENNEELEDVLNLDSGTLWTMEEEKLFEYGLYLHDGSGPDRFGQISGLMCGTRSRDECRRRYMKLVWDVCQIEAGQKSVSVMYFSPYAAMPHQAMHQQPAPWLG